MLVGNVLPPDMARVMEGVLFELANIYADTLNTPQGRVSITDWMN